MGSVNRIFRVQSKGKMEGSAYVESRVDIPGINDSMAYQDFASAIAANLAIKMAVSSIFFMLQHEK